MYLNQVSAQLLLGTTQRRFGLTPVMLKIQERPCLGDNIPVEPKFPLDPVTTMTMIHVCGEEILEEPRRAIQRS